MRKTNTALNCNSLEIRLKCVKLVLNILIQNKAYQKQDLNKKKNGGLKIDFMKPGELQNTKRAEAWIWMERGGKLSLKLWGW